jgi:hypothetical protein
MHGVFFTGVDPNGNVLVDGENASRSASAVAYLCDTCSSLAQISLSGFSINFAGMVQWYPQGNYWALGDQECDASTTNCIYWATISGTTATSSGQTVLGVPGDMVGGVIGGNGGRFLGGGNIGSSSTHSSVNRYPFEAGGSPTNSYQFPSSIYGFPIGAALSTK